MPKLPAMFAVMIFMVLVCFWYIKHVNASNNNITTRRYGEAGTVCLSGLSEMLFYMIAWWSEYMGFL